MSRSHLKVSIAPSVQDLASHVPTPTSKPFILHPDDASFMVPLHPIIHHPGPWASPRLLPSHTAGTVNQEVPLTWRSQEFLLFPWFRPSPSHAWNPAIVASSCPGPCLPSNSFPIVRAERDFHRPQGTSRPSHVDISCFPF